MEDNSYKEIEIEQEIEIIKEKNSLDLEDGFLWDGSFIIGGNNENILGSQTIREKKFVKLRYWRIEDGKGNIYITLNDHGKNYERVNIVIMKNIVNTLPIFFDEIKGIFGLHKRGTHYFYLEGKMRMIEKPQWKDFEKIFESPINLEGFDFGKLEDIASMELMTEIRNIYSFREAIGLNSSHSTCIEIRKPTNDLLVKKDCVVRPFAYSYKETSTKEFDYKTLPENVSERWFFQYEDSPGKNLADMLQIEKSEQLTEKMFYIRHQLEEIRIRIHKDFYGKVFKITIINLICKRINDLIRLHIEI